MAMFVRAHAASARPAGPARADAVQLAESTPRLADAGLHPPAARAAGLPRPPPARLRLDAAARPRALRRGRSRRPPRCRSARARWPASTSTPTAALVAASSASRASPRTRSTRSRTVTSCSTTSRRPRPARPICPGSGAEIVLWSSEEFGFCEVSDAWASGSSIMPQKKNPDAAELLRAKAPRVAGHLVALHGVMHGLPLTYNKDMQEDKEHLFDAVDTLELCARRGRRDAGTISFRRERLRRGGGDELLAATDVADLLVRAGPAVPRGARRRRRASCGRAVDSGKPLSELTPEELARASPLLDDEFYARARGTAPGSSPRSRGRHGLGARARTARTRARARCREARPSTTARCSRWRRT